VSLRRLFWQGAAATLVLGALLAISAVLGAGGGDTTWKALATLGVGFVCGSTALASLACLERGVAQPVALGSLSVATATFLLWSEQIWAEHDSEGYWQLLGMLGTWTLAGAVATGVRLVARSPRTLRGLYPATVAAAAVASLTASVMILRENGDGWQLLAILAVLAALGSLLTPVVERLAAPEPVAVAQSRPRTIARTWGLELVAARGAGDARIVVGAERDRLRVRVDGREITLAPGELLALRPLE
jgi:hypothetical protein